MGLHQGETMIRDQDALRKKPGVSDPILETQQKNQKN
jgi:hypothetical protein